MSQYKGEKQNRFVDLPKIQYIQKIEVREEMAELYQQFILKLISAHKAMKIKKTWTVYENPITTVRDTREYIFIRGLDNWGEIDDISEEDPLSEIMKEIYGEKDAMQWLSLIQKSVKRTTTTILSKINNLSYSSEI